ncbi:glutamate--tRNA ligase [Alicyclobacillus contaminans]|uniref:glutamate--tRNA ligase n=1 Tax=Alicyclobacillus contaminans TaxID=392016 RepID=UPI00041425F0|nr:glutamate--tRNA ligase [Alicyclobacillus contaminans]GMA52315.1 glutamate--tRNA ligase [Alicyclobacillus contaminans]
MTEDHTPVRVRFAPSPTGSLHIGGARTAYFNWLFARQSGGTFVLRIDDTDTARSTEASLQEILRGFRWLGIDWDEGPDVGGPFGPYRQSERSAIYREALQRLLNEGKVYPCFCSQEQLAADREAAQRAGRAPRYARRCRDLTPEQVAERMAAGETPVYRFKSPIEGETVVHDRIRGDVVFSNEELDDFVVWKPDGMPTYHFASCVDDAAMHITHVIRAEEHLSNTPKHVVLFEALGAKVPEFAHVPMILAPDRSKLSKRHGATSVQEYRDQGILPDALINYLLLLGFAPGEDKEILSREEAIQVFRLDKVTRHAAVYDVKKLEWLNAQYFRSLSPDVVLSMVWPTLRERGYVEADPDHRTLAWIRTVLAATQERSRNAADLVENVSYYFRDPVAYDEKGVRKHFAGEDVDVRLERLADILDQVEPFGVVPLEQTYRSLAAEWQVKAGMLIHPTRLAITGVTVGPGLFDVMALLGRAACQSRLRRAANWIRTNRSEL